jgi:hypothetical protein
MRMWLRFWPWRRQRHAVIVLGTYRIQGHTVRLLGQRDRRVRWVCDCETYEREGARREPLWCPHIDRAAARRSLERLTRWIALPLGAAR